MKNAFAYIRAFFAALYSYVNEPAELAGAALFVVVTVIATSGLISGWQIVVAYALAVGTYVGLRPKRIGPDGAKFGGGGDGDE